MSLKKLDCYGGTGGNKFSDDPTEILSIEKIVIKSGKSGIHKIETTYVTTRGERITRTHGKNSGVIDKNTVTIELAVDEYVIKISGYTGKKDKESANEVRKLTFITSKGKEHICGVDTGTDLTPFELENIKLAGFYGRSADRIDQIGFFSFENSIRYRKSFLYGEDSGYKFIDDLTDIYRIEQIIVKSGKSGIHRIETTYVTTQKEQITHTHGKNSGVIEANTVTIKLAADEYINEISGYIGKKVNVKEKVYEVRKLIFTTSKRKKYDCGVGTETDLTPFELNNIKLAGFYGRSGDRINQIGFIKTVDASYYPSKSKNLKESADPITKLWAPVFDFDKDCCYSSSAISPEGVINPGMSGSSNTEDGCRTSGQLENSNCYHRSLCIQHEGHTYCVHMYALYFLKDTQHRHDWEASLVWTKNNELTHASWSAHGHYTTEPKHKLYFDDDNHVKIVYHQGAGKNIWASRSFRSAKKGEKAENYLGRWFTPTLVDWHTMSGEGKTTNEVLRDGLNIHDFGSANCLVNDKCFPIEIIKKIPKGYPAASVWKKYLAT